MVLVPKGMPNLLESLCCRLLFMLLLFLDSPISPNFDEPFEVTLVKHRQLLLIIGSHEHQNRTQLVQQKHLDPWNEVYCQCLNASESVRDSPV